ncbi:coproporphyrinogen III oxidase [Brevibacillus marinus]|uniref:coproporphyrinogen III oxidase n=1 Tax=Brevibacillus marinus TaxID=2496837 RepID=UPI000F8266D3|nr:coproporphyrinogen III oxidase [Brevibacillus marinus]
MIEVKCTGHAFEREISHILALFYQDPDIAFVAEWQQPEALQIELALMPVAGGVRTHGVLRHGRYRDEESCERLYKEGGEKGERRTAKQAINATLLNLMERYTGLEQGWGILTGIRPTKLLHQLLRSGRGREEAHRYLRSDCLVRPEKLALLQEIADRQLAVIPDLYQIERELSVYIGIPFCPTKCAYCTFPAYAIEGQKGRVRGFLEGLHYEIRAIGGWMKQSGMPITSIYFGGGTPTSITAEELDELFAVLHESFPGLDRVREWTVEAGRPDTITPQKLEVLKKWRVDRISINPQSFSDATLAAIGRHHSVAETIETFQLARQMGIDNINMDLIIGLPNEGLAEVQHSFAQVERLLPDSLTVHTLSFKRASEMTQHKERYQVASRAEIARMMAYATEWTRAHGYRPYYLYRQKNILGNLENVGYALPGKESIYNVMIMEEAQTILGLGCGAVSKLLAPASGQLIRWPNPKDPKTYNETYRQLVAKKLQALKEIYFGGGATAHA